MDKTWLHDAQSLIVHALAEDLQDRGDITTQALFEPQAQVRAELIVKQEGVLCGLEIAEQVFMNVNRHSAVEFHFCDADRVRPGDVIGHLAGQAAALITAERTALNFLGRLSGIATLTRQFVDLIAGAGAQILDTRKTTPGWRRLEKYAVVCGGGVNHRMGLYDLFLVKDNHIAAAGSISRAVQGCRHYMEQHSFHAPIEVETKNIAEVEEALQLGVDRIMLDNMSVELMARCVERVHHQIPLEASGRISLDNVRAVAETGVDFISIGALTHSARVLDISMDVIS
jgi:nicotinate-nucleotide pyrophosphorylase (carboxylating)